MVPQKSENEGVSTWSYQKAAHKKRVICDNTHVMYHILTYMPFQVYDAAEIEALEAENH